MNQADKIDLIMLGLSFGLDIAYRALERQLQTLTPAQLDELAAREKARTRALTADIAELVS